MPAWNCPYCRAFSNFSLRTSFDSPFRGDPTQHQVFTCDSCVGSVLVQTNVTGQHRHPQYIADEQFPDVPEPIAGDAHEAFACFGIGAWRAASAMARRALQAAAYEKGAPDGPLIDQIDWLAENGHITAQMKEVGHRIRLGGNLGAHPDRDGLRDVDEAEATAIMAFLRDFFRYVYEIPADLARIGGA
jgi:hypothetical protein